MTGRLLGLAVALCGCQTILPLADGGDGGIGAPDGGGGGDPGLQAPIPAPKPGCPPAALQVTAAVDAPYPFTRRAPVQIRYDAPGAARVEFRSDLVGEVEADRSLASGTATFSFQTAPQPIWTGAYRFTVLAFDAAGCAASAQVDLPVDGDLLVGTREAGIYYVGTDGRVLGRVALPMDDPSPISALAIREDPLRVLVGFDHADGPLPGPALVEVDTTTGAITPFALEDIQGDPLYPSGERPGNLVWSPDGARVWADGVADARLHAFHPDGRHDRTVQVTDDSGARDSVLGRFAGDRLFAGTDGTRRLYTLDPSDTARTVIEFEDAFSRVRHLAVGHPTPAGEPTVMTLLWIGNDEVVERHTVLGQAVDQVRVSGLSVQVVTSGDALLTRSTAGGIQVHPLDGGSARSLFVTREFAEATGEDFITLGAMIKLDRAERD